MADFEIWPCKQDDPASVAEAAGYIACVFFLAAVERAESESIARESLRQISDEIPALASCPHELLSTYGKAIDAEVDKKRAWALVIRNTMRVVTAYVAQARIAQRDGNFNLAWGAALDAVKWTGWLEGQWAARYSGSPAVSAELLALTEDFKKQVRSESGRHTADGRYNQPNGYREKKAKLRKKWASGVYPSRRVCAEKECESSGVTFRTAYEKWLRGAPDPDPWPAKKEASKPIKK